VYTNRVLEVLSTMQSVQMHALPEIDEDPWTVDDFCNKMDEICRSAATELHRKSLMVEEAVEEILTLVRKARIDCPSQTDDDFFSEDDTDKQTEAESSSTQQQSDWSLVWECFEKPHILLSGGLSKAMEDMVRGAVTEMRRYYSRKVVDVLVRVTRQSLEALRRRFSVECATSLWW
jgi:dynein heavy chain